VKQIKDVLYLIPLARTGALLHIQCKTAVNYLSTCIHVSSSSSNCATSIWGTSMQQHAAMFQLLNFISLQFYDFDCCNHQNNCYSCYSTILRHVILSPVILLQLNPVYVSVLMWHIWMNFIHFCHYQHVELTNALLSAVASITKNDCKHKLHHHFVH